MNNPGQIKTGGYEHRFGGLFRLYGKAAMEKLRAAHILVVGIGGVGSWAAEALARCGVGRLTLVDFDDICYSNINRQLHALSDTAGLPKVEILAGRIRLINPECRVETIQEFYSDQNADELIQPGIDYVVDAIDKKNAKIHLITQCKTMGIPVIVSGGAGGRIDPSRIETTDLRDSYNDPLLAAIRKQLRKNIPGMHLRHKKKFGIPCVFSAEEIQHHAQPAETGLPDTSNHNYGSSVFVTGSFGFAIAARIINDLTKK